MNAKQKTVEDVLNTLNYYKTMGFKAVPVSSRAKREISTSSPRMRGSKETLELIHQDIGDCKRCGLCKERTHIVFGEGNSKADLMFIGEGPGRDEDKTGRPFVGRAGQLLTKIIEAMKLKREDVYIANIVKCRPPNNRVPLPEEVKTCETFLHRQIEVIQPKVIVCLGATALQNLLKTDEKISKMRGHFIDWKGVKVMPTYHPAFLLRNPNMKKPLWDDMKKVMAYFKEQK